MTAQEGTCRVHGIKDRPRLVVTADGAGIVSHAGSRLLADLAARTGLTGELSRRLSGHLKRGARHDPGRVLTDLAVMIADGGECLSDIATLGDQRGVFGPVASDSTCWRLLDALTARDMAVVDAARAAARERAWAIRAETTGQALPASLVAGLPLTDETGRAVLVLDLDATIVPAHSEKEWAAPTFKRSYGFHPLLAFCDNTREALAGVLRPGNAGSNTAADHVQVLDAALAQVPDAFRHGHPVLVRADGAGQARESLAHIDALKEQQVQAEFSVGWAITDRVRTAIAALPASAWTPALDTAGEPREDAAVAELTAQLGPAVRVGYPPGTRVIVRREPPHPGAQLDLLEERDGYRYTTLATNTPGRQHQWLDARHRAHARVEDRIRTAKDTGLGRMPSRQANVNTAWLACALIAIDLLAWTQTTLLHEDPELAKAEPKALRYRPLHTAARIVRGGRRHRLRLDRTWPWAPALAAAFTRLNAIPAPL